MLSGVVGTAFSTAISISAAFDAGNIKVVSTSTKAVDDMVKIINAVTPAAITVAPTLRFSFFIVRFAADHRVHLFGGLALCLCVMCHRSNDLNLLATRLVDPTDSTSILKSGKDI